MSAAAGISTAGPLPVVIAAGTPITCELGHIICVAAMDCHANEPLAVEMFTRWQGSAPEVVQKFPVCHVCEGAAHRQGPDGVELHTPQGWQSLNNGAKLGIATKADVDKASARLDAKFEAMSIRFERALW